MCKIEGKNCHYSEGRWLRTSLSLARSARLVTFSIPHRIWKANDNCRQSVQSSPFAFQCATIHRAHCMSSRKTHSNFVVAHWPVIGRYSWFTVDYLLGHYRMHLHLLATSNLSSRLTYLWCTPAQHDVVIYRHRQLCSSGSRYIDTFVVCLRRGKYVPAAW